MNHPKLSHTQLSDWPGLAILCLLTPFNEQNTVDGKNPAPVHRYFNPIIFKVLYITGGAGFLPSTVAPELFEYRISIMEGKAGRTCKIISLQSIHRTKICNKTHTCQKLAKDTLPSKICSFDVYLIA